MFERFDQIEARYEELNQRSRLAGHRQRLGEIPEDCQGPCRSRAHRRKIPRVQRSDQRHRRKQSHARRRKRSRDARLCPGRTHPTGSARRRGRRRSESSAAAQRSQRRKEHHPRNPRRHRRRRSHALRRRNLPHVHPLRRNAALEGRSALVLGIFRRRPERSHRHHRRHTASSPS